MGRGSGAGRSGGSRNAGGREGGCRRRRRDAEGSERAESMADADPGCAPEGSPSSSDRQDSLFDPSFEDFRVPETVAAAFAAYRASDLAGAPTGTSAGEPADEQAGELAGNPASGPACEPAGEDRPQAPVRGGLALGRVVRLDRGFPLVTTADGAFRAEHAVAMAKEDDVRPTVGDWVALRLPDGHDKAVIERVMPRTSDFSRWDGANRGLRQTLAANLDLLIVVQPLSKRDVPVDRIMRSLVLAAEGGVRAAVVLTKADRSPSDERRAADGEVVRGIAGAGVPVLTTSCADGSGVEEVRALIAPGETAMLLGESGAGKSTLVNALLGADVLGTGEVRSRDDRGRHTTVARRMLKVPGAGVLVDAPGLRSLPLLDEELGLARTFPEIAALEPSCRFRDCTHGAETGCAVTAGVRSGAVAPGRLEEYRLFAAEMKANRRALAPSAKSSLTQ